MQLILSLIFVFAVGHGLYSYLRKVDKKTFKQKAAPWLALEAITVSIGAYIGAQVVTAIIFAVLPLAFGMNQAEANVWLQENIWANFLLRTAIYGLAVWFIFRFLRKRQVSWGAIGLGKFESLHVAYALAGYALYFVSFLVAIIIVSQLFPGLNLEQRQELGFDNVAGWSLLLVFVCLVVLPPLAEEIIMRGFMFTGLRTTMKLVPATLITSGVFAVAHLPQASGAILWVAAVDTFVLSLVLCYLRERSGSLWPAIGLHFIKNGISFIAVFNILSYLR